MRKSRPILVRFAAQCFALALLAVHLPAAEVRVDGVGFFGDRELRKALERLLESDERETLDANAIEDAAVILGSTLGDMGFQAPKIEIEVQPKHGAKQKFTFDPTFASPLPRPLAATEVTFRVDRGVRSYLAAVEVSGLTVFSVERAAAFFRTAGLLVASKRTNAYAPARVDRGVDAILSELRQRGYIEAEVRAEKISEVAGAISLRVTVREGPRWEVAAVRYQLDEAPPPTLPKPEAWVGKPWSPILEQDFREAIRQAFYREGYPDVGVHVEADMQAEAGGIKRAEVIATIIPGSKVAVGQVRFEGNKVTRESVLRRRVRLSTGEPLDPLALERSRYRIARLGVFESIDLRYEPAEGSPRDPVFTLKEGSRHETNLLFGYGSYEQLRAGVEYRQKNIFGLAHQSRAEVVHSLKSTSGDYTYTVPELFGESLDGTAKVFGLRRREIAFLRQEFGTSFTLRRAIAPLGGEATVGYTFQTLRNTDNSLSTRATDDTTSKVASISLGLTGDNRDSPLRPRRGFRWSAQTEVADPTLGGEVTYQRFDVAGSYHTSWGSSRWIHLGLSHGVITTIGANDVSLPVNKRFLPGGDNSIRGYQRGEAAPRDPSGQFIGAKAFTLLNLELEQALTPSWSVVAFVDALGMTATLRSYPFDDRLYSAGLGVRYQTLIGPVRLEYGRNINPRRADPSGTWQFSVGFPF